jgi:hypothetical protein
MCLFLFLRNSFKLVFTLFGIELKVNVITIQLSLLNVICIFGPIEHNTFTLGIHLFCGTCLGCFYCLTSGRIATMQMENITEVDASLLQLHVSYLSPSNSEKSIYTSDLVSFYFIVIINFNH